MLRIYRVIWILFCHLRIELRFELKEIFWRTSLYQITLSHNNWLVKLSSITRTKIIRNLNSWLQSISVIGHHQFILENTSGENSILNKVIDLTSTFTLGILTAWFNLHYNITFLDFGNEIERIKRTKGGYILHRRFAQKWCKTCSWLTWSHFVILHSIWFAFSYYERQIKAHKLIDITFSNLLTVSTGKRNEHSNRCWRNLFLIVKHVIILRQSDWSLS